MDWLKLLEEKKHYTDLPEIIQKKVKTKKQWEKEGLIPKKEMTDIECILIISIMAHIHISMKKKSVWQKGKMQNYYK